jgi:hypothetical protein
MVRSPSPSRKKEFFARINPVHHPLAKSTGEGKKRKCNPALSIPSIEKADGR